MLSRVRPEFDVVLISSASTPVRNWRRCWPRLQPPRRVPRAAWSMSPRPIRRWPTTFRSTGGRRRPCHEYRTQDRTADRGPDCDRRPFQLGGASPILPLGLLLAAVLATRLTDGRPRFSLPVAAVNSSIFAIALVSAWRLAAAYGTREVILLGDAFGGLQAVLLFERKTADALGPAQLELVDRVLVDVPGPRTAVRLRIAGVLFLHPGHALSDLPRTGSAAQLRRRRRRAEIRGGQSRARQLVAVVGHRRIDDDGRAVGPLLAVSRTRHRA